MDLDATAQLSSSSYYSGLYCCSSLYRRRLETGRVEHGAADKFKYLRQPSTIYNLQSTSRHISVSRVSVYLPGGLTMQCMQYCNICPDFTLLKADYDLFSQISPLFLLEFYAWHCHSAIAAMMAITPMSRLTSTSNVSSHDSTWQEGESGEYEWIQLVKLK